MSNFQNWYVGQTYPSWDIPLVIASGASDPEPMPEDLTGVDATKFTMIFHNTANNTYALGTGTFSIKRNYPGEILYKPSPADVAATFTGTLIIKVLFPPSNGTADEVVYDPIPFSISSL